MYRPENVRAVTSLEEFAKVIEEGRKEERVVVVRFVATWCKVRRYQTTKYLFDFYHVKHHYI